MELGISTALQLGKFFLQEYGLIPLNMFTGIAQLSSWLVDDGRQISYCWSGSLQKSKGKSQNGPCGSQNSLQNWRLQYKPIFNIKCIHMVKYRNIYRNVLYMWVCIHTYTYFPSKLRGPKKNDISVVMSNINAQFIVFNTLLQ